MRSIYWIVAMTLVAGCATAALPPAQSVTDVKVLAGTYDGWASPQGINVQVKLVVQPDGTWEAAAAYIPGGGRHITGRIWLVGSQLTYESTFPSKGTMTYHVDGSKRLLHFIRDNGVTTDYTSK